MQPPLLRLRERRERIDRVDDVLPPRLLRHARQHVLHHVRRAEERHARHQLPVHPREHGQPPLGALRGVRPPLEALLQPRAELLAQVLRVRVARVEVKVPQRVHVLRAVPKRERGHDRQGEWEGQGEAHDHRGERHRVRVARARGRDRVDPALDAVLPVRRAQLEDLLELGSVGGRVEPREGPGERGAHADDGVEELFLDQLERAELLEGVLGERGDGALEDGGVARAEEVRVRGEEGGDRWRVVLERVDVERGGEDLRT